MLAFHTLEDMETQLTDGFEHRYRRKDVALTGILLARPEDPVAREAVLPHLQFWHYRADCYVDFFCAGYVPPESVSEATPTNVEIDGRRWGFSTRAFVELVEHIEAQTGWRYNGDACLLLANSYFDGKRAHLDFARSIRINFREALEDKTIATPTEIADTVFYFAKEVNEGDADPVWELSDKFGRKLIRRGLKDAFMAWLPEWLRPSAKAGFQFVVHEVRAG